MFCPNFGFGFEQNARVSNPLPPTITPQEAKTAQLRKVVCKEGIFGRGGGARGLEFNWVPSDVQIVCPRFGCPFYSGFHL